MIETLFPRYLAQGVRPLTERDFSEFAALLTPRVKALAKSYSSNALDRDGLANQALCTLLQRISEQAFPLTAAAFEPYMVRSIQNALRNAYRDQLGDGDRLRTNQLLLDEEAAASVVEMGDPELPDVVRSVVERAYTKNRFVELTPVIFRYIAESLLTGRPISKPLIQRFGLCTKVSPGRLLMLAGQLVAHVELLIRIAMYDIEESVERDGAF